MNVILFLLLSCNGRGIILSMLSRVCQLLILFPIFLYDMIPSKIFALVRINLAQTRPLVTARYFQHLPTPLAFVKYIEGLFPPLTTNKHYNELCLKWCWTDFRFIKSSSLIIIIAFTLYKLALLLSASRVSRVNHRNQQVSCLSYPWWLQLSRHLYLCSWLFVILRKCTARIIKTFSCKLFLL